MKNARITIGTMAVALALVGGAAVQSPAWAAAPGAATSGAATPGAATASEPAAASSTATPSAGASDETASSAAPDAAAPDAAAAADPSLAQQNASGDHAMGATIDANEGAASAAPRAQTRLFASAATGPSGSYAKGFDISAYQTNSSINWGSVVANGAKFVYMKATEGTSYTSSQFSSQWASATNAGLVRGAYVYAQPAEASGAATANFFAAKGGSWSSDGRTLPPLLDIEYGSAAQGTCYGLSKAAMVSWISSFVNQMHSLTGRYPAIYTTTDWWTTCTGNSAGFGNDPFFVARYTTNSSPGSIGASWSTWNLWQWADSGVFPGDQDVFNGTISGLTTFAAAKAVPVSTAIGSLDSVTTTYGAVNVRGWAADKTTSTSTKVSIQVDGSTTSLTANGSRPDVGAAYPSLGSAHGFSTTLDASAGSHTVCAVAFTAVGTASTSLGCSVVTVPSASPFGRFDSAVATPGGIAVGGWAIEPDASGSTSKVVVNVDGRAVTTLTADGSRPDVGAVYPADGPDHGYSTTLTGIGAGNHTITVTAINTGRGQNTALGGPIVVRVPGSNPTGNVDATTAGPGSVSVRGWTLDGDTTAPIVERTYIDGVAHSLTADQSRPDVGRVFPGYGSAHGFSATYSASPGAHTVCVYGLNVGAGTTNPKLAGSCRTVTVAKSATIGRLDSLTGGSGTVTINGWTIDPDTSASITARAYIDGRFLGDTVANQTRKDVAAVYPAFGAAHGYRATFSAARGTHTVCVYGLDVSGGTNTTLGCKSVAVG